MATLACCRLCGSMGFFKPAPGVPALCYACNNQPVKVTTKPKRKKKKPAGRSAAGSNARSARIVTDVG